MELTREQVDAVRELLTKIGRAGQCRINGGGRPCRDCWSEVSSTAVETSRFTDLQPTRYDQPLPVCGSSEGL